MRVVSPTTPSREDGRDPARARTVGILSTYPPTACGLATFSAALAGGLATHGAAVRIVRVVEQAEAPVRGVVGELRNGSPGGPATAAELLNDCDVAVVQHEYGLYGGTDGDEVLDVLAGLRVPAVVVAHTILADPTPHQRSVLVDVVDAAQRVVVMSEAARQRLCAGFDVDPAKVVMTPHGATLPPHGPPPPRHGRPMILTSGLLGPGKGVERVIAAMASLHDLPRRPRYVVAGKTHPKVLAADGEAYRTGLVRQSWREGVAASVLFDDTYRDVASLTALLQSATVVVLPYDSTDQVTSGVLVDAVAAGRPVIATAFPHAVELLGDGAGIVVDHDDPDAMALALHRVLTEADLADHMAAEAARVAPSLSWPVVAGAYMDLADELLVEREALV